MSTVLHLRTLIILAVGAICLGSCDQHNSNKISAEVQFESLVRDGHSMDGKRIAVAACIRAHPHGMELIDCRPANGGIPLDPTDTFMRADYPHFYEMALRSRVESKSPPKVYVCGAFHLASRGDGRWISVESMSSNGLPEKCRAKRDESS